MFAAGAPAVEFAVGQLVIGPDYGGDEENQLFVVVVELDAARTWRFVGWLPTWAADGLGAVVVQQPGPGAAAGFAAGLVAAAGYVAAGSS